MEGGGEKEAERKENVDIDGGGVEEGVCTAVIAPRRAEKTTGDLGEAQPTKEGP